VYREQAELVERCGATTIRKQHLTCLYSLARYQAFASRNILSGWSKSGLRLFNPEWVQSDNQKPSDDAVQSQTAVTLLAIVNDFPDTLVTAAYKVDGGREGQIHDV
jgi:hypothetical protein